MPPQHQLNLPPAPVQRLETKGDARVQKVDTARNVEEIPLEMAKAHIGSALRKTIARTDSVLKDFGDPSQVKRVCDGDVPSVIARAFMKAETRREFVRALAEESGEFDVRMVMSEVGRRTA